MGGRGSYGNGKISLTGKTNYSTAMKRRSSVGYNQTKEIKKRISKSGYEIKISQMSKKQLTAERNRLERLSSSSNLWSKQMAVEKMKVLKKFTEGD